MTRADKLKPTSDPSCEATRIIKKNCKPGKSKDKSAKEQRKNKDKGGFLDVILQYFENSFDIIVINYFQYHPQIHALNWFCYSKKTPIDQSYYLT